MKGFVCQEMQVQDAFSGNGDCSPSPIAMVTVACQGELVVKQHAAVEQHTYFRREHDKTEPVKVPECCKLEFLVECCKPSEDFSFHTCAKREDAFQEMSMPDEDFEVSRCNFHFNRFVLLAHPKVASDSVCETVFFNELFERGVKEIIKVCSAVRKPQISVVARDTIEDDVAACRQRFNQCLCKHTSTFVDLFETDKFKFETLFRVDALSVHNVAEEIYADARGFNVVGDGFDFICDAFERLLCCFCIPSSRFAPKVEIADKNEQLKHNQFRPFRISLATLPAGEKLPNLVMYS